MCPQSFSRFADRIIARFAARQHGVVARCQLLDAGVTGRQIKLRLRNGRLHEIHRGVYLVGHTVPPPLAVEQAALLACGKAAVLSHRSAAKLWDLLPYPASAPAWVTVPSERSAERPRIASSPPRPSSALRSRATRERGEWPSSAASWTCPVVRAERDHRPSDECCVCFARPASAATRPTHESTATRWTSCGAMPDWRSRSTAGTVTLPESPSSATA